MQCPNNHCSFWGRQGLAMPPPPPPPPCTKINILLRGLEGGDTQDIEKIEQQSENDCEEEKERRDRGSQPRSIKPKPRNTAHGHSTQSQHTVTAQGQAHHGHSTRTHHTDTAQHTDTAHGHSTVKIKPKSRNTTAPHRIPRASLRSAHSLQPQGNRVSTICPGMGTQNEMRLFFGGTKGLLKYNNLKLPLRSDSNRVGAA